jgi:alpha-amylase
MKMHFRKAFNLLLILPLLVAACTGPIVTPTVAPAAPTPSPTLPPTEIPPTVIPTPSGPFPVGEITGMPEGSEGFPWWDDCVFYEIFVRSFFDSNGDGIGDFNGILQKLDYLNDGDPSTHDDLGVTCLWLMPIFPSPSYHGYDVTDYNNVNPDYGTLDDFKKLLEEAHKRGIRLILDMPLNHTSSDHTWFKQAQDPSSSFRDWYIWSETDPGYLGPWGEQVWHPSPDGKGYYYGVFVDTMPDLNYLNPRVVDEINKVVKSWLDAGVDGFRLDGARYIVEDGKVMADSPANHEWFKQLRTFVKSLSPEALILGEVWTSDFAVSTYVKGDELDLAFDFDLANAMMNSANAGNADKVNNQLTFSLKTLPNGYSAPFLTNHDMDRVISLLDGDVEKAKNAATKLLTATAAPFIYYGEEIGMSGARGSANSDISRRLPMQWSADKNAGFTTGTPWAPVYPFYTQTNVAVESTRPESLLAFYQNLIRIRNQHVALRVGATFKVTSSQNAVYAILRAGKEEQMLIVVNLANQAQDNLSLSLDEGPLKGVYRVVPVLGEGELPDLKANDKGGFDSYQPLPSLPPNARLILQLQPEK